MTREDKIRVSAIGYALITLTPLFVVLIGPTAPQRGFWIEFAVALGFIGLAMLGLQSVLTARFPRISGTFGQDALLQFHRQAGIVAFGFVLAHPIILLLSNGDYWAFLDLWKQALWVVIGSASIGSVLYVRAIKPLRVRRHPYRITSVDPLTADTWAVTVEPEGDVALGFDAGQFAFLTIADTPFSLEEHPFTIASSARCRDSVEFAVKELGDFTGTIGELRVGSRCFVDGPYGSMRLTDPVPPGLVLVAGGIGITPAISMLRTLRDDASPTPATLVYANEHVDGIAYRDEIDEIAQEIDLTVVYVVRDPEPDAAWTGPTGVITPELLAEHLPTDRRTSWHYVLCGPPPMMEAVERTLLDMGVPVGQIESERFDIGAAEVVGRRGTSIRRTVLGLSAVMVAGAALFAA